MAPLNQTDLPLFLTISGGNFILGEVVPLVFLWGSPLGIVRPDTLSVTRPTRGTVTHTADSAFLDDWNIGVGSILIAGNTGYSKPEGLAGLPAIKALELLFLEYLARRKRTADAMGDPDQVVMGFYDVLNAQAFTVYPIEFSVDRQKGRGNLLYYYRIRLWILKDLLHSPVLPALPDFATNWLNGSGITDRLSGMADSFGSLIGGLF